MKFCVQIFYLHLNQFEQYLFDFCTTQVKPLKINYWEILCLRLFGLGQVLVNNCNLFLKMAKLATEGVFSKLRKIRDIIKFNGGIKGSLGVFYR